MENLNVLGTESLGRSRGFSPKINKAALISSDALSFIISAFISIVYVQEKSPVNLKINDFLEWHLMSFLFCGFICMLWLWGAKRHYTYRKPFWDELYDILKILFFMSLFSLSISSVLNRSYPVDIWFFEWSVILCLLPLLRNLTKRILNKIGIWSMPCVIIGDADNAHDVLKAVQSEPSTGFEVIALVSPSGHANVSQVSGVAYISQEYLLKNTHQFYKVFIATEKHQSQQREYWIRALTKHGVRNISIVPALRGIPLYGTDISHFFSHEVMMLRVKNNLPRRSSRFVKRLFDIFASSILLLLLSPLFAFIAWKVSRDGGPATYGHERVGLYGRKFKCLKFRSMVINSKEVLENLLETDTAAREEWQREFKLKNDPRVTEIGKLLRRTSLDELPQLWNVFKGDMSLVGPRPIIDDELLRYKDDADYYLLAKPGMSGLWQVSGRSDTDYDTRVYLDSWYVKNWSLWYDIVILFKTITVVLKKEGAY
ncbi:undecaprenyl-phosphate galactose phosphotransferase WbaP [Vibrio cholerae]|uniref:undecaprenyl-phosphate galactose phosphotransferase WbaP n=2 Tax=Vibrio cholerae TaxID=666 RepID=UPI00115AF5CA|nr:undecaprenyl-phosphate galactose phosphotransferase WbaP [Vibrio cholerae]TQO58507.1 undecaprenyl-phosphate galactose phosphotransferase WbaP [Vibrio cholerae]